MISRITQTMASAFCVGVAFCAPSHADLLDLSGGLSRSYSLQFTAVASQTTISFSGYQNPSYAYVSQIGLTDNGNGASVSLLSPWTHTLDPEFALGDSGIDSSSGLYYYQEDSFICTDASTGTCALMGFPANPGITTANPAIVFANPTLGDFDFWSQTIATPFNNNTNAYDTYTLNFYYTNNPDNIGPSALAVTVGGSAGGVPPLSVPEFSTWAMMLMGLAALGALGARRKLALELERNDIGRALRPRR
jgi:hypothetical protein